MNILDIIAAQYANTTERRGNYLLVDSDSSAIQHYHLSVVRYLPALDRFVCKLNSHIRYGIQDYDNTITMRY